MVNSQTRTVTLLFTDIEGSTELLQRLGDDVGRQVIETHRRILRTAFQAFGGREIETQGDAFLVAFAGAFDAIRAATNAQRGLHSHTWPKGDEVRVRMALHTGPIPMDSAYVGLEGHRVARICGAAHGGQILTSESTRVLIASEQPTGVVLRDLGRHRLRDLRRPESIFQVVTEDLPADFPPLRTLDARQHNLPVHLTSFIGRSGEMRDVIALLTNARLLTLTGSGGSGKSRLALQVAAEVLPTFPDGTWLVQLASLVDPNLVPQALATTLGVRESHEHALSETIVDSLRAKSVLLIMDNCEHLANACGFLVSTILEACPKVRVLATSRQPLSVPGEITWHVPSLSLPRSPTVDPWAYDAVKLFYERAKAARPDFRIRGGAASEIVEICQHLDGIPLAIELAAARTKILSTKQIASRLQDRFQFLTSDGATTMPRHRTLRATIDWSHELLSELERQLFRRLSVFAGGSTLEAIEAICNGGRIQRSDIIDLTNRLVDKSLIVVEEEDTSVRFRMLETVRHYAHEKLAQSGEGDWLRRAHRDWYLQLAELAEPQLRGFRQKGWLELLDRERDNFRAAMEWSINHDSEQGLRLAGALSFFWHVRGYVREGRQWLETALAAATAAAPPVRAKALLGLSRAFTHQENLEPATRLIEESLAIWRSLGDLRGILLSLQALGIVAWRQQDLEHAVSLLMEALSIGRHLGKADLVGGILNNIGIIAITREDFDAAEIHLKESLALSRSVGDLYGVALAAGNLAVTKLRLGEYQSARLYVEESLGIDVDLGDRRGAAGELEVLAMLAAADGDPERAARILGGAEAIRDSISIPLSPVERLATGYEKNLEKIRNSLPSEVFTRAWSEGKARPFEALVSYAMEKPSPSDLGPSGHCD